MVETPLSARGCGAGSLNLELFPEILTEHEETAGLGPGL